MAIDDGAAVPLDRRRLQQRAARRATVHAAVGGAMLAIAGGVVAQELPYVRLGFLSCQPLPGPEFSTGSATRVLCQFRPEGGGPSETYSGRVRALRGVAAGPHEIRWEVLAPKGSVRSRWLAAQFSARATRVLSVPVRQDSLIGARNPVVVLQPVAGGSTTPVDELALTAAQ